MRGCRPAKSWISSVCSIGRGSRALLYSRLSLQIPLTMTTRGLTATWEVTALSRASRRRNQLKNMQSRLQSRGGRFLALNSILKSWTSLPATSANMARLIPTCPGSRKKLSRQWRNSTKTTGVCYEIERQNSHIETEDEYSCPLEFKTDRKIHKKVDPSTGLPRKATRRDLRILA